MFRNIICLGRSSLLSWCNGQGTDGNSKAVAYICNIISNFYSICRYLKQDEAGNWETGSQGHCTDNIVQTSETNGTQVTCHPGYGLALYDTDACKACSHSCITQLKAIPSTTACGKAASAAVSAGSCQHHAASASGKSIALPSAPTAYGLQQSSFLNSRKAATERSGSNRPALDFIFLIG